MKNIKYLILTMLTVAALHSCSNDEQSYETVDPSKGVEFTSSVEESGNPMTRAIGSAWSADDKIGVFMKNTDQDLSATSVVGTAANVQYMTAAGDGNFFPFKIEELLFYPKDGKKVDFIAYYPFSAEVKDFVYKAEISNQADQEAIDFLYSNNLKGASKDNPRAHLQFKHLFSRMLFSFKMGDGVSSLQGLKVTIAGLPTKADVKLTNGEITVDAKSVASFDAKVSADGTSAEAIVLPMGVKTIDVTFTLGSLSFKHKFENVDFKSGSRNNYNITIKNSGGEVDPKPSYQMWTETPLFTPKQGFDYVVTPLEPNSRANKMRNYSMLYDQENRVALWIAYPLHAAYFGNSGRTDAWQYDPAIKEDYQPELFSSWASYPPYNRGHQIASSDRTISKAANATTFYFSNMTLQDEKFNGGTWAKLEEQAQNWSGAGSDTLFVVTGVILSTKEKPTIEYGYDKGTPSKKAAIPQYFYKVLAKKVGAEYQTIGFRMPNVTPPAGDVFNNYRVTVKSLEEETGYSFFPSASQSAKENIGSIFK